MDKNLEYTPCDYLTKMEYFIHPTDAEFMDYCSKTGRVKTYTITVEMNDQLLVTVGNFHRFTRLAEELVIKPMTFIQNTIGHLRLTGE
jgi:hypothetical protein